MPAPAVIPALKVYINIVVVKTPVVNLFGIGVRYRALLLLPGF